MFSIRSPRHQDALVQAALKQIEKMLKEISSEGKDLSRLKLKRYQKTHHVACTCDQCKQAKIKNDPRQRGLLEYGFKVYIDESQESL